MSLRLAPYPEYRDSGVPWLGNVPAHWDVRRQRNVADMLVSNVDKHTVEGELPVRLCNYVDVYKNDRITERVAFMRASASPAEVERFRLTLGDVLITKDSESWNDIGVPALVEYSAPDLVCGYHLAILRPRENVIHGAYLFRATQSQGVASQYHVSANGVTRYGLSQDAMKSVILPLPLSDEQDAIARFLDHADHRINRLLRAKRRLIELLNEQKQAIIHRTVTRGLDPNVRLKPSGIDWLGNVPEGWESVRLKYLFREVDDRSRDGDETLLSMRMYQGLVLHSHVSTKQIPNDALIGFKRTEPSDIVMNRMRAAIGMFAVTRTFGIVSPDYAVLRPVGDIVPEYFLDLFKTPGMHSVFRIESRGLGTGSSGFLRLYMDRFGMIHVPCPPVSEQAQIIAYVTEATRDLVIAQERIIREISLVTEYRTRLIADVVTGKLDVRGVELPPLDDDSALDEIDAPDDGATEEPLEAGEDGDGAD